MSTATEATRKIKSPKYPNWEIERVGATDYIMSRPAGIFAIGVGHSESHGWEGMLLTRQSGGWRPAKTPYVHSVVGCVQEADRREKAIAKYGKKPLARPSR